MLGVGNDVTGMLGVENDVTGMLPCNANVYSPSQGVIPPPPGSEVKLGMGFYAGLGVGLRARR